MEYVADETQTRVPTRSATLIESRPLVPLPPSVLESDSEALAIAAGVDSNIIEAVRNGIPYWRLALPGVMERVAPIMGTTAEALAAGYCRAHIVKFGRGPMSEIMLAAGRPDIRRKS